MFDAKFFEFEEFTIEPLFVLFAVSTSLTTARPCFLFFFLNICSKNAVVQQLGKNPPQRATVQLIGQLKAAAVARRSICSTAAAQLSLFYVRQHWGRNFTKLHQELKLKTLSYLSTES